ncbi:MAG: hypothetical protein ACPGN3_16390 [Opitutales bacterium]
MRANDDTLKPVPAWALWKNPIFLRYCRSTLRPRSLGVWTLIVVLISVYAIVASVAVGIRQNGLSETEALRIAFIPIFFLQMFIMFVLGMANVSGGITREGDEGVIDYQRLMPLTPLSKVVGYLFGLPIKEYLLFAITVPFTAYIVIRSEVNAVVWVPLYLSFFSSAILYHLTGLLTGTVIKNRRWAFLASMAIVFSLYTIIPELSKFGINVFKYLTIRPVIEESWFYFIPENAGMVVNVIRNLSPSVGFFGLKFPAFLFVILSQGGLIFFFMMMLCRYWRRRELSLLSKPWAIGFFTWVQIMILGNALPVIPTGEIFPSVAFSNFAVGRNLANPDWEEAAGVVGVYGTVTLCLMLIIINIITPDKRKQIEGWRRASKLGMDRLPWGEEGKTALPATLAVATIGAVGWFLFMRALIESVWFPGHYAHWGQLAYQSVVMIVIGLSFHALLEFKGRMAILFAGIFSGVVPILSGVISAILDSNTLGIWIAGLSPLVTPSFFVFSEIGLGVIDPSSEERAIPYVFKFSLFLYAVVAMFLVARLRQNWRDIKASVVKESVDSA